MPALIAAAYASLFTLGLIDNVRGPFFPEILKDLELSGTQGGAFFAASSLLAVMGSLTAHRFHRLSTVNMLLLASLGFGITFAAIGQAWSFPSLVILCGMFGFCFGVLNVVQNVLVTEVAPAHLRRRILNGLHAMYGIAALTAPLIATSFRQAGLTWRHGFFVIGLAPIFLSLIAYFFKRRRPTVSAAPFIPLPSSQWLKCGVFALFMSVYLWGELSISSRLVLWLRSERAFAPDQADFLLAGFFLALLSGRVFFSLVKIESLGNWAILMLSAIAGSVFYLMSLYATPWWLLAAGLALSPFFPVIMDQASITFKESTAQAMGLIIGTGNLSLVVMHLSIGWISDRWGLTVALGVCAGALMTVGLALLPVALGMRPSAR